MAEADFLRDYVSPTIASTLVGSPRFGHTSDISTLFGDEPTDYMSGLIFAAAITGVCFIVIMLTILIFMCCGQKRSGFLSGAPFEVTGNGSDDTKDDTGKSKSRVTDENTSDFRGCLGISTTTWVRVTFILSGITFILFAVLLVTEGITNLQETVRTVHQSSIDIGTLSTEAEEIINVGLRDVRGLANNVRVALGAELEGDAFCPADPGLDNNEAAADVRDKADQALDLLGQLDDFMRDEIDVISEAITEAGSAAAEVEEGLGDVDLTDWEALLILIPFTFVPCLLVAAAILAHFDVEFPFFICFINWFLMPLFILMVVACAVVATLMIAAASANSDFCLPGGYPTDSYDGISPDTTMARILDVNGYQGDTIREVADFYLAQCQDVKDPYTFFTDYVPELTESQSTLKTLLDEIQSDGSLLELSLYCNREFDSVEALLTEMQTILDVLLEAITRIIDLLSCERIVPIYHRAVYDGACQYSVSAVFWVFCGTLIMGFFGLIMIMFRSSYKPTSYKESTSSKMGDEHSGDAIQEVPTKNASTEEAVYS